MYDKFFDQNWRLESLYRIVNKQGQKVLFNPNSVQRRINQSISKRKMILKARQMGVSTNELIKQLDFVLWNKNMTACILAHEQDAIEKLFRIPRKSYEFISDYIGKPELDRGQGSKYEMYFPSINSRIFCDLENRGSTINWLHISEMAFVKDIDRVKATLESVPIDGIVTIESTPNGLNNFYDMWMQDDSNYEKVFFPWFIHDEYKISNHDISSKDITDDELSLIQKAKKNYKIDLSLDQIAFRRFKQRELKGLFQQEYPEDDMTCFLTSGNAPFQLDLIKPLYDKAPKPLRIEAGIKIYEEPKKDEIYVIGADTAEGVSGDSSAAHVFKVSNREQVACYKGNLKPSEFADKLNDLAEIYSSGYPPVLLAVERNNHGHAVILKLDEVLGYANLYRIKKENKKKDVDEIKIGWVTDRITRPIMIDTFIEGVENGTIILNDRETLGECLTLINNNGKIEAEEGKHDDLVIAAAISIQLCIEEGKLSNYSSLSQQIRI